MAAGLCSVCPIPASTWLRRCNMSRPPPRTHTHAPPPTPADNHGAEWQAGWAAPNRCAPCRKTNKAKVAAEAAAVVPTEEEVITIVAEAFAEKPAE